MPLKKCSSDQKSGYKWGNEGKCYTGPDAKKKAIKQGLAIEGPAKFSQNASALQIASAITLAAWHRNGTLTSGPTFDKAFEAISDYAERNEVESYIYLNKHDIKTVTDWMYEEGYDHIAVVATAATLSTQSDQIAGYPPNCNHGYRVQDGKCVPIKDVEEESL